MQPAGSHAGPRDSSQLGGEGRGGGGRGAGPSPGWACIGPLFVMLFLSNKSGSKERRGEKRLPSNPSPMEPLLCARHGPKYVGARNWETRPCSSEFAVQPGRQTQRGRACLPLASLQPGQAFPLQLSPATPGWCLSAWEIPRFPEPRPAIPPGKSRRGALPFPTKHWVIAAWSQHRANARPLTQAHSPLSLFSVPHWLSWLLISPGCPPHRSQ